MEATMAILRTKRNRRYSLGLSLDDYEILIGSRPRILLIVQGSFDGIFVRA